MAEITITKENFEQEVINSQNPILLDFWASWCGPCRMLSGILEELDKEYEGKLYIGKINVDEQPELADQFEVDAIPLLVLMKNGKPVEKCVGVQSKSRLREMLR